MNTPTQPTDTPVVPTSTPVEPTSVPTDAGATASQAKPTLYVCHGDEGGPRIHPCRRVQEAMQAKGVEYDKVVAAHGSPIPFLRKGSREGLREATGDTKLPTLKLPDGTVIKSSRAIMAWVEQQP